MKNSQLFGETVKLLDSGSENITEEAKDIAAKFRNLTGWELPLELKYWLDKDMPEGVNYWIDSFEIEELVDASDSNDVIDFFSEFSNHHYLFTGLFEAGRDGCGDGIFFYLGQHCKDLQNIYWYDHEEDELRFDENSLSFMAVDWALVNYEENEDLEDIEFEDDEDLQSKILDDYGFSDIDDYKNKITNLKKHKHELKDFVDSIDSPSGELVQEVSDRYRRSYWLSHLLVKEICYEFKTKVSQSPNFQDWLSEKEQISNDIHLYNYWIFAHFFLGNHKTCQEIIEIGKRCYSCGLIKAINEYIERGIENDELEEFIQSTKKAATDKHFEV